MKGHPGKGAHKMPDGKMMSDAKMKKPKFGTPEFFSSLKKKKRGKKK